MGLWKEMDSVPAGNNPGTAAQAGNRELPKGKSIEGRPRSAMSLYAKDRHKRALRSLGYCLTLDSVEGWQGLDLVFRKRLTANECKWLAYMALCALDDKDVAEFIGETLGSQPLEKGIGMPIAAFDGVVDEAAFWADMAEPAELDAYCLACFNRMTSVRKQQFLIYVKDKADEAERGDQSPEREAA